MGEELRLTTMVKKPSQERTAGRNTEEDRGSEGGQHSILVSASKNFQVKTDWDLGKEKFY